MRKLLSLIFIIQLGLFSVRADEGMWLPHLLQGMNMEQMQKLGIKLTAEDIYDINNSSLKDAIVHFGGGCTGEIISSKGLVLTNMHCGYSYIQQHSSLEHNYLKDGFWAKSIEEEIPTPGLSVRFLVRIENVSGQINAKLKDAKTEEKRQTIIREMSKDITEAAENEGKNYVARVASYYGGNEFYLLVYQNFTDVRLVGNPPVSIGDFGSLTDNWMWPRHKADFSLFRVYMSPDGEPADYSAENIPLKPKHHLPVSTKGVSEGDFAMIMGYPGRTDRYMSSFGIKEIMEVEHPNRIKIRGKALELMNEDMELDPAIRLKYAAKYKGRSNYWKYSIGQMIGLERLKTLDQKIAFEQKLQNWIQADKKRTKEYGAVFTSLEENYKAKKEMQHAYQYISEALNRGNEVIGTTRYLSGLEKILTSEVANQEKLKAEINRLKSSYTSFAKNYNAPTDRKVSIALIKMFMDDVDEKYYPESMQIIKDEFNGSVEAFVDALLEKSIFASDENFEAFVNQPSVEKINTDLAVRFARGIYSKMQELQSDMATYNTEIATANRLFVKAMREMNPEKNYYPDANSTMRVTYGSVGGYNARDAVNFDYITTLQGVIEKEDSTNYEFIVPDKLKELYETKDYGEYGINGKMPVCFVTNNDITGGNSGSPVIGANGELIGLAFDSNWEGMSGDIAFEHNMQRTVCVDARYLLFVIDKFAGAKNIIDELDIVK